MFHDELRYSLVDCYASANNILIFHEQSNNHSYAYGRRSYRFEDCIVFERLFLTLEFVYYYLLHAIKLTI